MADFNNLKTAIRAAIYENEDQAITGDALQEVLLEMVTDINAAKQDALTPLSPLGFNSNGALILNYSGHGITLDQDGNLGVEAGNGLTFVDSTLVVYEGRGIVTSEQGALEASLGDGLAFDPNGAIVPDFAFVQAAISDLATIRSGAAAGATAYQLPADGIPASDLASGVQTSLGKADTAVQSATISTIVSLSQQDYDDLVDKDAATLYVII